MFSTPAQVPKGFLPSTLGIVVFLLFTHLTAFAQGAILAEWIGASQGDWSNEDNWECYFSGGNAPCVPNDTMGNTFKVNIDNSDAVVNLSPTVQSLALGVVSGDTAGSLSIGAGNTLTVATELDTGVSIPGSMNITQGGVINDVTGTVALGPGSNGSSVTVSGKTAKWTNSGELDVGVEDHGTLTIRSGGVVSASNMNIGDLMGGIGAVTVTGKGSQLSVTTNNLNVAGNGGQTENAQGTLTVSSGGLVSADPTSTSAGLFVGTGVGSKGTVSISGSGSKINAGLIYVGSSDGDGTLTVSGGGVVTCASLCGIGIGSSNEGTGTVTITGTGSQWNNTQQQLGVGYDSAGTLKIENGGVVTSAAGTSTSGTSGYLGSAGGSGTAEVTGAGSQWNQNGGMRVGFNSPGTLTISGGGAVNDLAGSVSYEAGASGKVTVTGNGSAWNNSSSLDIAPGAAGTLTISSGGLVTVGTSTTAGAATLAKGGSLKILTGGGFSVLGGGSYSQSGGTLTVDGAFMTSALARVYGGSMLLPGAGSLLLNGGSLFGNGGNITASVTSSATVTPADSTTTTGVLTVTGNYTQTSTGTLSINVASATQFNQLSVTDVATLGGTLKIGLLSGFVPSIGTTFPILSAGSVAGTFSKVVGAAINSSEHFTVQYSSTNVTLAVVAGAA